MLKLRIVEFTIIIFFLSFVCTQETRISMVPEKAELNMKPGETEILTLKVTDNNGKIVKILGFSREFPGTVFELSDNGENEDKNAEDGIWSDRKTVPNDTRSGKYHLDFEAFDSDGNNIMIKTETGEEVKLTTTIVAYIE